MTVERGLEAEPGDDPGTDEALRRYFAECRARIPAFAARHFGFTGTLRLHAEALGLDLLRAPLNLLLVGPALALRLAAAACRRLGLRRAGRWLAGRNIFVETRLSRRIAELILGELLGLDAARPQVPGEPSWYRRAHHLIAEYVAARHAVAELAAGLVALTLGLVLLQALTPSALSLGPLLAEELARREAVESFWLGPAMGALYHVWWPAAATPLQTLGATLAAMLAFALLATFMGLVTDPLQQALGLHRRRLERLIDALERAARGERDVGLSLPDPYLARLADLADIVLLATRLTR